MRRRSVLRIVFGDLLKIGGDTVARAVRIGRRPESRRRSWHVMHSKLGPWSFILSSLVSKFTFGVVAGTGMGWDSYLEGGGRFLFFISLG